jgi:hypothetical protein
MSNSLQGFAGFVGFADARISLIYKGKLSKPLSARGLLGVCSRGKNDEF